MSTMTSPTTTVPAPPSPRPPSRVPGAHLSFPRVLTSEWIKLRTLRSTTWTLVMTVMLQVGLSVLLAWGITSADPDEATGIDDLLLLGVYFAQLTVATLGVLSISGEYSTGMIRSSTTAVPKRLPVLWAKAIILTGVLAVVGTVSTVLSIVATIPFHDELGITLDLTDGGTLRTLIGVPLYMMAIGLLAFAIGALLRHTAGAITTVFALLLIVENVVSAIPLRLFTTISPYMPSTAGRLILADDASIDSMNGTSGLTAWQGYGVLMVWVAVLLTAAAVLLRRRDA